MTDLLTTWRWTARKANVGHLRATDSKTFRNAALGGVAAVLGALVGLGVFATLQTDHVPLGVRITAGAMAFAAAGSAALWKFLDYGTDVEKHRTASRDYGNLVRRIDHVLESPNSITDAEVQEISDQMDAADNKAPNVPGPIWIWAVRSVAKERANPSMIDASTIDRGAWSRLKALVKRVSI